MNQEIKVKWIGALRSGHYKQTKFTLRYDKGFCCLGVLCDVVDPTKWGEYGGYEGYTSVPPCMVIYQVGLTSRDESCLVTMNDIKGSSFDEIADYIEANL